MRATKPEKPRPDFPLTAHPSGTWCKKVKGKLFHFGGWADPEAAEAKYLWQRDDLQAGRPPRPMPGEEPAEPEDQPLTLEELCFAFLDSKEAKVSLGKMTRRMLLDYKSLCVRLTGILGRTRKVEALKPGDFDTLAGKLSAGVSPTTASNRIRMALVVFRHASKYDLIEKPLKFGDLFKVMSDAEQRVEKRKRGNLAFEPAELRRIIDAAGVPLKAMILLGCNCAFGNHDCATVPLSAFDLKGGWCDFPRPKTEVERRCPLWPETVQALQAAIAARPQPATDEYADLLFLTRFGNPYCRLTEKGTPLNAVSSEFAKLLTDLKLNGNRRAFYSLRRTFQTIAEECNDIIAVRAIMGHSDSSRDMSSRYRQGVSDERLLVASETVRKWLDSAKIESTEQ